MKLHVDVTCDMDEYGIESQDKAACDGGTHDMGRMG